MAQVAEQVGLVKVGIEPNGSLGVELAENAFTAVPVVEHQIAVLNDPRELPAILQTRLDQVSRKVMMPKSATYSAVMNMQALAARASGAVTENVIGKFLEVVMGGKFVGTGTTINDASPSTTLNTFASGTNFREGGCAVFATGTGGTYEARVIKTVSTNDVTLKHTLTGAPANSSVVYAGATYYLDNMSGASVQTLQMILQGLGTEDRWLCKAGQCLAGFSMETANGAIPRFTFPITFADWAPADGTETTMNLFGDALTDANFSTTGINALMDSELRLAWNGGSSEAIVPASDFTFTPNIAYAIHKFPGGNNNTYGYVRSRAVPVMSGSFLVPYEAFDDYFEEHYENADEYFDLQLQIGTGASGGILIDVPHAVIDNVQREDMGGIAGQRVTWFAREDSDTTTNSTNIQKSAFRIHIF